MSEQQRGELNRALADLTSSLAPLLRTLCDRHPEAVPALRALGRVLAAVGDAPAPSGATSPLATSANGSPSAAPSTTPTPAPSAEPAAPLAPPAPSAIVLGRLTPAPAHISGPTPPPAPPASPEQIAALGERFRAEAPAAGVRRYEPVPELRPPPPTSAPEAGAGPDFATLETHFRLRVKGCQFAVQRAENMKRGGAWEAVRPAYESLRAEARPVCYLWMLEKHTDWIDAEVWQRLARAYELMADVCHAAASDAQAAAGDDDLLRLVADSQSLLKRLLEDIPQPDPDQKALYDWCYAETQRREVYIPTLALSNLVKFEKLEELRGRLSEMDSRRRKQSDVRKLLNQVGYHAKQIAKAGDEGADHHWAKIAGALREALGAGVPPSDRSLRDALLPVIDRRPDEVPGGEALERVVAEIDRFLSTREREGADDERPETPSPEVARVRELLRGRRAVLIGGEARQQSRAALERAFELSELVWISSREHESIETFRADCSRPDTALVMLAIRWASHSFEGVKEFCEKAGKPYVRLPRGYNPNQVAHEILKQVSGRLEAEAVH